MKNFSGRFYQIGCVEFFGRWYSEGSIVELAGQAGCCRINYQLKVCFNQNYSQKLELLSVVLKIELTLEKCHARCSKKNISQNSWEYLSTRHSAKVVTRLMVERLWL
jgi:hypothetical protein